MPADASFAFHPTKRAGLSLRATSEGFDVLDTHGAQVASLNDTAGALWQVCDGRSTVAEIVQAAAELFDAPAPVIEADVLRTIATFRSQGLLEDAPDVDPV